MYILLDIDSEDVVTECKDLWAEENRYTGELYSAQQWNKQKTWCKDEVT